MKTFSNSEIKIIKYFKFESYMDESCFINNPIGLYRLMVDKAFLDNDQSKFSNALRIAYNNLLKCKCYRMTKEFDSYIEEELI